MTALFKSGMVCPVMNILEVRRHKIGQRTVSMEGAQVENRMHRLGMSLRRAGGTIITVRGD
jgi:hypothetical protein